MNPIGFTLKESKTLSSFDDMNAISVFGVVLY